MPYGKAWYDFERDLQLFQSITAEQAVQRKGSPVEGIWLKRCTNGGSEKPYPGIAMTKGEQCRIRVCRWAVLKPLCRDMGKEEGEELRKEQPATGLISSPTTLDC